MEEENQVAVDTSIATEEVDTQSTDSGTEESAPEESVEELKARLAEAEEKIRKADEVARNQKIRAEKAEKAVKTAPKAEPTEPKVSIKDMNALIKANVAEEDIEIVEKFARFEGVSIAEALKNPIMRNTLQQRAEERNTAIASNTSSSRRSNAKVSEEVLLDNASKGKLPDSDDDISRLIRAKAGYKKG